MKALPFHTQANGVLIFNAPSGMHIEVFRFPLLQPWQRIGIFSAVIALAMLLIGKLLAWRFPGRAKPIVQPVNNAST